MENNRNIIRVIILIIGLLVGIVAAFASQPDSLKPIRPVQLTFIYPIGTNGFQSQDFINHFSINTLGGISGGTQGFEAGGLFNADFGNVTGAQFAGLGNLVLGSYKGAQFSGLVNLNTGGTRGAFFAGLTNTLLKNSHGAQFAGITNIVTAQTNGAQVAGISNLATGTSYGLQLAGIANLSIKNHQGAQIAGILNYTKRLNGFQLGMINVADTLEKGTPLGFISFVHHGYHRVELEGNELFFANFSFKTGVPHLYNVFSVGYRPKGDKQNWGVTYGLGTYFPLNNKLSMNFDLTATHINEGESWTDVLNMVNRLKWNVGFRIHEYLELYGGISFNVALSRLKDEEGRIIGSTLIPSYVFYDDTIRTTNVKMYPGFNLGIRI
jgi:hypothetical protein